MDRLMFYAVAAFLLLSPACAHAETTVALTTTVHADATPAEKKLAVNLLALLEVETSQYPAIQVVERQQLDLALHELVLSSTRDEQATLQLGKLAKANLILTAKLLEAEETGRQQVLVRITQAATAVIQGVTAVPISPAQIEEASAEIAGFLATTAKGPKSQLPTIAVLPFESVERFDRLRPLERGLRDLFASALLRKKTCRVVQRSSMEQLLTELDLVRSGLTAGGRGLGNAPAREAAYVLRGEIDERTSPEGSFVIIIVELVEVKSRQVVAKIERSSQQQDLADKVSEIADEISGHVANGNGKPMPAKIAGIQEIDRLYEMALRDVFRFIRYSPDDAGYSPFEIPSVPKPSGIHPNVKPESLLGVHLMQKSIDRLESVLFIEPNRLTAALPLAYCLSFHVDGIWQPKRCEQLLRQIQSTTKDNEMHDVATRLLADMYFPHEGCFYSAKDLAKVDPNLIQLGFNRRLEAYGSLPKGKRKAPRSRLLRLLKKICQHTGEEQQWSDLLQTVEEVVEAAVDSTISPGAQNSLLGDTSSLAIMLARNKSNKVTAKLQAEAENLLQKWYQSEDPWRRLHGARGLLLNRGKISEHEYGILLDEVYHDVTDPHLLQIYTGSKTWLATRLRNRGEVKEALGILEGFQPKDQTSTFGHDFSLVEYGYQLGQCYEELGRRREALETYLRYTEMPFGYSHGLDISRRIDALGGVPLNENRDVNVRYPEPTQGTSFYCKVLATDGKQLFCSGGFQQGRRGPKAIGIRSVQALHIKTGEWTHLGGPDDRVACLAVADGYLWAGTDHQGLWRMSLANRQWRQWTTDDGLPTNSVVSVAAHGPITYASIGNIDASRRVISGGVVRVDPAAKSPTEQVHIYRGKAAPQTAPTGMAIHENQLVVKGISNHLHLLDLPADQWQKIRGKASHVIGAGPSGFWYHPHEQIASLLDLHKQANKALPKSYPAAPLLKDYPAGHYYPKFFVEHDGQLWIGGYPWRKFGDTGLFRLDLESGTLKRYGPRDGFRHADHNHYECYDGVWADDRLWVATSFGLAEVAMRNPSERDRKTPVEGFAEKIRPVLPKGWECSVAEKVISLRRKEKVLYVPLYGRPPGNAEETEDEYLRRIGIFATLEIDLRFVPRMTDAEHKKLSGIHSAVMQQGKNGFHGKRGLSRHHRLLEKFKLPIYFTADHTIFVDGVPPQYTMHDDAAHREMKELFAKLKPLLQLYEGAEPLPY